MCRKIYLYFALSEAPHQSTYNSCFLNFFSSQSAPTDVSGRSIKPCSWMLGERDRDTGFPTAQGTTVWDNFTSRRSWVPELFRLKLQWWEQNIIVLLDNEFLSISDTNMQWWNRQEKEELEVKKCRNGCSFLEVCIKALCLFHSIFHCPSVSS